MRLQGYLLHLNACSIEGRVPLLPETQYLNQMTHVSMSSISCEYPLPLKASWPARLCVVSTVGVHVIRDGVVNRCPGQTPAFERVALGGLMLPRLIKPE